MGLTWGKRGQEKAIKRTEITKKMYFQGSAADQGSAEDRPGDPPRTNGRAGRRRDARAARLPMRQPDRGAQRAHLQPQPGAGRASRCGGPAEQLGKEKQASDDLDLWKSSNPSFVTLCGKFRLNPSNDLIS